MGTGSHRGLKVREYLILYLRAALWLISLKGWLGFGLQLLMHCHILLSNHIVYLENKFSSGFLHGRINLFEQESTTFLVFVKGGTPCDHPCLTLPQAKEAGSQVGSLLTLDYIYFLGCLPCLVSLGQLSSI